MSDLLYRGTPGLYGTYSDVCLADFVANNELTSGL